MKSNIVKFERKSAQKKPQPDLQEFLHSVFFMSKVIEELLPKVVPENHSEREFIFSRFDKHLSVIHRFTEQ
ncbi:MAG: hypothetical protein PHN45_09505 [Methylococcales bacterium]|nr:hypothetical protein [Methylococcales bacterium]MDD5754976.1 hypothetical protein [Methylococcales bacterium]